MVKLKKDVVCNYCEGRRETPIRACPGFRLVWMKCLWCGGSGSLTQQDIKNQEFGEKVKQYRIQVLNKTLRQYCFETNMDPVLQSCLETGRWADTPPGFEEIVESWHRKLA
jgi:hypothetical protein